MVGPLGYYDRSIRWRMPKPGSLLRLGFDYRKLLVAVGSFSARPDEGVTNTGCALTGRQACVRSED